MVKSKPPTVFDTTQSYIITLCHTPEEVYTLLSQLIAYDWEQLFIQREKVLEEWHSMVLLIELPCDECSETFKQQDLIRLGNEGIPGIKSVCSRCADIVRAKYARTCYYCGEAYYGRSMLDRDRLCPTCLDRDDSEMLCQEMDRLKSNLKRAIVVGLPATLTLKQWIATIEYFNGLCAYCQQEPFTDMEHFIPIVHGGGTTFDNCVPACHRCNMMKSTNNKPDQLTFLEYEPYSRVKEYLASQNRTG